MNKEVTLINNKTCLVTGGKGFIGSHLVQTLLANNNTVVVFDNEPPDTVSYFTINELNKDVFYVQGDILQKNQILRALREYNIEYVFHLAAQPITPLSNKEPDSTFSINAEGTQKVCEAMISAKSNAKLIFSSSACYYGLAVTSPLKEDNLPNLRTGYSVYTRSKIAAEKAISRYYKKCGLKAVICRFVNVYGPGDRHISRIVPKTIKALIHKEIPTLTRSHGDSVFSFMYVDDAVSALLLSATNADAYNGEIFNFGLLGDNPRSVIDLVKTVFRVGEAGEVEPLISCIDPEPKVIKYLDPSKAERCLLWEPMIDIEEGLRKTITWEKEYNRLIEYFSF